MTPDGIDFSFLFLFFSSMPKIVSDMGRYVLTESCWR